MMENKIKAILEEGRCIKEFENEARVKFVVPDVKSTIPITPSELWEKVHKGEIDGHLVTYDKNKDFWICTCTAWNYGIPCSHVEASKRLKDVIA